MLVDISFVFLLQTIGVFASAVLAFRLLHRLYYVLNGHLHYYSYDPKKEMEKFLQDNSIKVSDHLIKSTIDNVNLRYRKIGTGKKYYLLANGVGTDFYMWLPVLQQMLNRSKQAHDSDEVKKKRSKLSCKNGAAYSNGLFDEITLVVLSYRGLFETQDTDAVVNIEINYCIEDIIQVMKHVNIPKYDGVIGWSTGAQISLALIARYPNIFDSIFLLNPSLGMLSSCLLA